MPYKPYTGVGSRQTPRQICDKIFTIAVSLGEKGYMLRSGGADGADKAFENGADFGEFEKEIYLPWATFNSRKKNDARLNSPQDEAFEIAAAHHPGWRYLSRGARLLHARNVHQVLGPDVTNPQPSLFIICWTKDGKGAGGTGQALRLASSYEVGIYDLGWAGDYEKLEEEVLNA